MMTTPNFLYSNNNINLIGFTMNCKFAPCDHKVFISTVVNK